MSTPTPRPALKATGMRRRHARCLETELAALTAERDRLRAERDSIKQEIELVEHRAYRAEADLASNCKKVSVLREALMSLMAEQGSNAERPICRDRWQAAMDKCRAALTATEDAK